ncbi:16S rRNA (cytidine(1402)-2'-O)-methyltransferase [uncultured Paraglaciecola sp.]|uniref:16S rRNA (cytidine(1402)-2'-O)-methyltransferase n=1 Tax=uncultured Paraglaciecola sp. TaxID=1765024 RepID=UPI00262B3EF1|nr:16S rRNA (cytidine(1402)-2'-O)-methyltransferase [uncultured Paraglaciecola sp.]
MTELGTLYIVATPIGNLEDISHRALRILAEADLIAAEDTRHSQRLLQHYSIATRLTSLHDHNESQRAKQLIEKLKLGENIALISDAGTPLISDPGYGLVTQCRDAGLEVVPIPGPCAAITALCAAGLATDQFKFAGFLPVKAVAKQQALQRLLNESSTSVFYESPRRVADTVRQIVAELGETRQMVVAKELTKTFETFYSGSAQSCLTWLEADANHQRGEFVLMIAGVEQDQTEVTEEALNLLKLLIKELPLKKAAALTAEQYGLKKNHLYQLGLELKP